MKEYRGNPENRHYDGLLGYITPEDDRKLLKECTMQAFKGKHKENKHNDDVNNAVRLIHNPTGIRVVGNEPTGQAENKKIALDKLR